MPESTYDGLFEDLAKSGFGEKDLESVFTLNLIEMHSAVFEMPINQLSEETEVVEWFELTDLGSKAFQSLEGEESGSK